jgi:hypothetical protein
LGSQLASYAWGAANVIFVVGAQELVPDFDAAHERIYEYSLKLEDARAFEAYGLNSRVGKILEIHQEDPGLSTSSSSVQSLGSDGRDEHHLSAKGNRKTDATRRSACRGTTRRSVHEWAEPGAPAFRRAPVRRWPRPLLPAVV